MHFTWKSHPTSYIRFGSKSMSLRRILKVKTQKLEYMLTEVGVCVCDFAKWRRVLLLACSQDWTCKLQMIVSSEAQGTNAYNNTGILRQTPEEGRGTCRPKRCGNSNKDEDVDNSPKILNDKKQNLWFGLTLWHTNNCRLLMPNSFLNI